MLKQSMRTDYLNVKQKVHRTAQLSQTANKQIRTSPAPLPFPCTVQLDSLQSQRLTL
jgi:hypothetical protein